MKRKKPTLLSEGCGTCVVSFALVTGHRVGALSATSLARPKRNWELAETKVQKRKRVSTRFVGFCSIYFALVSACSPCK